MDDFRRRPVNRMAPPTPQVSRPLQTNATGAPTPGQQSVVPLQPIEQPPAVLSAPKKHKKKKLLWIGGGLLAFLMLLFGAGWAWYMMQLSPVNNQDTAKKLITIQTGATPKEIAEKLQSEHIVRSAAAFLWYTRFEGVQNTLQAGAYRLSPSESTQEIVAHLTKGNVDSFTMTFIPGQTLAKYKEVFKNAGYSDDDINKGFGAQYSSPLFSGKPASADLEGYIYPDTYKFSAGATVEDILEHIFEVYYKAIEQNDLINAYKARNLTLFEGITVASIVQKEAVGGDEAQIAQVFLKRYAVGMRLGSDPTYQYITDKLGVPRDINYDSPYNTRRYEGLPPGPISSPGLAALKAVAHPAAGEYLYFLSGDDDVTYFSRTFAEHERAIAEHCKVKCQAI